MRESKQDGKWFGPRQCGAGLPDPISWQGWTVYGVAIVVLLVGMFILGPRKSLWLVPFILGWLVLFGIICWIKGPSMKYWCDSGAAEADGAARTQREIERTKKRLAGKKIVIHKDDEQ